MKKILFFGILLGIASHSFCQNITPSSVRKKKIAVFAPLYLDSVFNNNTYKYNNKNFPKFVLSGLEFVQGIEISLENYPITDNPIETYIYDTKSTLKSIANLISNNELDSMDLIIGSVRDNELTQLASFSKQKQIPFISATFPNDGGITDNPYMLIVNSTLKSHCEAIFSKLLINNESDKIFLVRKSGNQEDRVANYFNAINKPDNKNLLNIKTIKLDSNYAIIKNQLDSTKKNFIIGGSLDEAFATDLAAALKPLLKKYNITLIGMPNWDGFTAFGKNAKPETKDVPVIFTAPYFNDKSDSCSKKLFELFNSKYKGNPSEIAYKGFEMIYVFSRILNSYTTDFFNHVNEKRFKLFTEFNFTPITLDKSSPEIDYFENKHLYFIKRINGSSTLAAF